MDIDSNNLTDMSQVQINQLIANHIENGKTKDQIYKSLSSKYPIMKDEIALALASHPGLDKLNQFIKLNNYLLWSFYLIIFLPLIFNVNEALLSFFFKNFPSFFLVFLVNSKMPNSYLQVLFLLPAFLITNLSNASFYSVFVLLPLYGLAFYLARRIYKTFFPYIGWMGVKKDKQGKPIYQ